MDDVGLRGRLGDARDPGDQFVTIRMCRERFDVLHRTRDIDEFTEDAHRRGAIDQELTPSACRLMSYEDDRAVRLRKYLSEVMQNSATRCHAAR